MKLIFFDTETSGLDCRYCKIIELAMLIVEDGVIIEEYDEFINIGERIDSKITTLTGITNDMLIDKGIYEKDVAKDIKDRLSSGTLMIAHNCQFDLTFLYHLLKRHFPYEADDIIKNVNWLDTLTVLRDRKAYPHKFIDAIEYYDIDGVNSHRAIDDTKALYEVYLAMKAERDDLREYINVFGYNPRYGISGVKFPSIEYKKHYFNESMVSPDNILPIKGEKRAREEINNHLMEKNRLSVPGLSFTAPEGYKIVTVNDWQYGGETLPGYLVYNNYDEVCLFIRYIPPQYATINSMEDLKRYIVSTKYTIYENIQIGNANGFKAEYLENLFKGSLMTFLYVNGFNYGYKIRYDDEKYLSLLEDAVFSKTEINVTVTRTDENLIYSGTDAQVIETPYFALKAPKHWKFTEQKIPPLIRYELNSEKFLNPLYILVQKIPNINDFDDETFENPIFINELYQSMLDAFNAYDIRNYNIAGVQGKLFKTNEDGNIILLIKGKFSFLFQYSDAESLSILNSIQFCSKNNADEKFNENAVKREDILLCSDCKAENPTDANFCTNCGTKLSDETNENNGEINDVNNYLKELYDDGILPYYEYEANKNSVQFHKLFKELIELSERNAITDSEFKKLLLYMTKTGDKIPINHLLSAHNFYQSGSISRVEYSNIKNKVLIKCDEETQLFEELNNLLSNLTNAEEEKPNVIENLSPEFSKAMFLQVTGDFEGSLEAFDKVLRIEPNNIDALDGKGWSLVCLGRWQEALDASKEVLAIEPLRDSALDNKGCSLMHLNRWYEAIEPLQKAVNVNPLNDYAWNNLGQTYMHFERYMEAINCFDKVLEINPEHADAKKFKQKCLLILNLETNKNWTISQKKYTKNETTPKQNEKVIDKPEKSYKLAKDPNLQRKQLKLKQKYGKNNTPKHNKNIIDEQGNPYKLAKDPNLQRKQLKLKQKYGKNNTFISHYNINAKIEYDSQELKKYGLSIQNVSITCSEYKDSFFRITGDLIVTDSKKAFKYISYLISYTVYGKGKELGIGTSTSVPYNRKKDDFTYSFFNIPFDEVDKIRISVTSGAPTSGGGYMDDMLFQHEMDMMDLDFQHEIDMMDWYFFD